MNDERVVRPQLIFENLLFHSNRKDYSLRGKRDIQNLKLYAQKNKKMKNIINNIYPTHLRNHHIKQEISIIIPTL